MELLLKVVKALLCTLDVSVGTSVLSWLRFEMCFRPTRGQESGLDVVSSTGNRTCGESCCVLCYGN
jgi:hypothetical protein